MSPPDSRAHLEGSFQFKTAGAGRPRRDSPLFRLLVVGDFSGRAGRSVLGPLAGRRPRPADVDCLEETLAGFGAELAIPAPWAGGGSVAFRPATLDDFHPDRLLERVAELNELLSLRRAVGSARTAPAAMERISELLAAQGAAAPAVSAPTRPAAESTEDALTRLLGKAPESAIPQPRAPGTGAQAFIAQVVGASSSVVPSAPVAAAAAGAAAEIELASRLRTLLHNQGFQALEGAWRGLEMLVRRCPDDGPQVHISVFDASAGELAADPEGWRRLLRDGAWDFIAAQFTFGAAAADLDLLAALARPAQSLGATFAAAAHPLLVGCTSFGTRPDPDDWSVPPALMAAWDAFRSDSGLADCLLAMPRFLGRQPYGRRSDEIAAFHFEEIPDPAVHEAFLWLNPSPLVALLHAKAVVEDSETTAGMVGELPVFRFDDHGEPAMMPCAEAWLSERAQTRIHAAGLVPILSVKHQDAVMVAG